MDRPPGRAAGPTSPGYPGRWHHGHTGLRLPQPCQLNPPVQAGWGPGPGVTSGSGKAEAEAESGHTFMLQDEREARLPRDGDFSPPSSFRA